MLFKNFWLKLYLFVKEKAKEETPAKMIGEIVLLEKSRRC